jgi:hypothetical protein
LIVPSQYLLEPLNTSIPDGYGDVVSRKDRNDASSAKTISSGRKGFTPLFAEERFEKGDQSD